MTSERTRFASYWLYGTCRIRISYNSRFYKWGDVAFLKVDVLSPRGAPLPTSPSGHISLVLRKSEKWEADTDYVGYAQRLLGLADRLPRRKPFNWDASRQLPLF